MALEVGSSPAFCLGAVWRNQRCRGPVVRLVAAIDDTGERLREGWIPDR
jgi:hypothetical protein